MEGMELWVCVATFGAVKPHVAHEASIKVFVDRADALNWLDASAASYGYCPVKGDRVNGDTLVAKGDGVLFRMRKQAVLTKAEMEQRALAAR